MMYLGEDFTPDRRQLSSLVSSQPAGEARAQHIAVPAASELNTSGGLAQLNTILQSSTFLSGPQLTSTDIQVFSSLSSQPSHFSQPRLFSSLSSQPSHFS